MADGEERLVRLAGRLDELRAHLVSAGASWPASVHPANQASAQNLAHYVELRRRDIRDLQRDLAELGLSSLGRAEAHVLATVDAVRRAVSSLAGRPFTEDPAAIPVDFAAGERLLRARSVALLGETGRGRWTRIMVTLPSEAAADPGLVHDVVTAGAEVVRIRCAYGGPEEWATMIRHVREAEAVLGRTVTVTMDLAGPRVRTRAADPDAPGASGSVPSLRTGDALHLLGEPRPARRSGRPPRVACTSPLALESAVAGHRVFFDDGRLGAVVEKVGRHSLHLRITDAPPQGGVLEPDTRILLPDTDAQLPALTEKDVANLPFVARHADAVGLSFVRTPDDVSLLQRHLADLGRADLGLILKVETISGFAHLPEILLAGMRSPSVGVTIARGDLAVEAGYARLAEVQEEILWLCEAAHVPVVWATDVLDTLAKTGTPSRAEVTDAAMSGRAECVMLNPGPYVVHAVDFLDDLLTRMADHQRKKSPLLRQLRAWDGAGRPDARVALASAGVGETP